LAFILATSTPPSKNQVIGRFLGIRFVARWNLGVETLEVQTQLRRQFPTIIDIMWRQTKVTCNFEQFCLALFSQLLCVSAGQRLLKQSI
jgi:hypothetical protein